MADILIRGMEMPKNCIDCMFTTIDYDTCILAKNDLMLCGGRPLWCPLIPLPEGHGRLIDGDVMVEGLMKCAKNPPDDDQESRWFYLFATEIAKSCETIVPADVTDINVWNKKEGGINL